MKCYDIVLKEDLTLNKLINQSTQIKNQTAQKIERKPDPQTETDWRLL